MTGKEMPENEIKSEREERERKEKILPIFDLRKKREERENREREEEEQRQREEQEKLKREEQEKQRLNEENRRRLEEAQQRKKEEQERIVRLKEQQDEALREKKAQEEERLKRQRNENANREIRIWNEMEDRRVSRNKFIAIVLLLGLLALGYWALAPDGSDLFQRLESMFSSTPLIEQASVPKNLTNSIGMEFVLIPAGEFDMGLASSEVGRLDWEGPVHRVKISTAFYIGKYEVTQKQWRDVMGSSPSMFKGDNLPVEQVSWNDVGDFIKKLNEKEGGNKYRLPTEAEWEYAARAGTKTIYSFGDDESMLGDYAWYYENSALKTHDVGQKKSNPWGLYDMHGNVSEWVEDWYGNYENKSAFWGQVRALARFGVRSI